MKTPLTGLLLLLVTTAYNQDFEKVFDVHNFKHVLIANIQGDIKAKTGTENKIIVKGHQEIKLKINNDSPTIQYLEQGDTLAIYIATECSKFALHKPCDNDGSNWGYYDWQGCHNETGLQVDFEVLVPENLHVILSTINDGDIFVENIQTPVWANNINGNITLESVKQVDHARTINGDVTIRYIENPKKGEHSTPSTVISKPTFFTTWMPTYPSKHFMEVFIPILSQLLPCPLKLKPEIMRMVSPINLEGSQISK
ncbi:MAG: hypothetical protein IPL46_12620 [Saprospiraceae bacterium]|nr:hypothetical protein [Saprospiraceae bacterium]